MNWIRIARGMKHDPRIFSLAAECKVRPAEAVGLICNLLVELPEHARDGVVGHLPDTTLEAWALWHGKPGRFAAAFRAAMCDGGTVRSWEKHNGSAIREAERKREEAREWREKKKRGGNESPRVADTEPPPNPPRSGYVADTPRAANRNRTTVRDVTGRNELQDQTHTTTAREAGALAFDHPAAQGAYAEMRRTAPNPAAFDAMLKTVADPITGGPAYTWPEIGAALVELAPQGGLPSAVSVRAFCRRVRAGEAVPGGGDDADAVIARSFAKAEAEMRAQQQGAA